uniref:NADH-ubiquinone oxidoreductase chain 4 n=1 Tax=Meru phyllisae TaxID=535381 RepID=S4SUG8_9COLE|nr:NADH dehydrogenase subunit 4 [Meru phyllisae]
MLKLVLMMLFMIPLCFYINMFWIINLYMFMMVFLFMFMGSYSLIFNNISYFLGVDLISYGLILLSFWICSLMILSSSTIYFSDYYSKIFLFMMVILLMFLYMTFSSMDLFMFYLFFEGSLIPTLLLIMGWGYQPERIQAGIYLLFYTLFASLPMMLSIFYYYLNYKTLSLNMIYFGNMSLYFYICMILAFLIKIPMYFFHLWLPKAHVEAPVSGSMILAGIMLKLGGYGLIRVLYMMMFINKFMNYLLISLSLVGGLLVSLMCLRQFDMKLLIAYSSVAHMSMVLGSILTLNNWGYCGSYMLMIAHGFCSSGLFCLANMNYERLLSRSMFINKGMISLLPSLSLWWFLLCSSNMAAPPSLNLLGEISLINSLVGWSFYLILVLMILSFFSAAYSLFLYSFTQHGKMFSGVYSFYLVNLREYLLMFLHWFPLNILFLKSELLFLWF